MKKVSFMIVALMGMMAASCGNESDELSNEQTVELSQLVPVRVHVEGFSLSHEEFSGAQTRAAQDVADYTDVNAITLAFYKGDGTEAVKTTQLRADGSTYTTFGEFECSLPMGSYTMVAVAYYTNENSVLTLTSPTEATFNVRARETFAYTQPVTISNTSAVDISATLNRIVSMLTVVSSDGKTADVSNVRMTFSAGGKDFNPTTGFAIANTGFANTVGNSAAVGATSTSSTMFFLNSDEQNIDVTIETLDAGGNTLFSKTVTNVPFKRNRVTKLTGAMYTNEALSGTFQVETAWLDEYNANF
jgi:hypothetical protein